MTKAADATILCHAEEESRGGSAAAGGLVDAGEIARRVASEERFDVHAHHLTGRNTHARSAHSDLDELELLFALDVVTRALHVDVVVVIPVVVRRDGVTR